MGGVAGRESVKVVGHVELPLPIAEEEAPVLVLVLYQVQALFHRTPSPPLLLIEKLRDI